MYQRSIFPNVKFMCILLPTVSSSQVNLGGMEEKICNLINVFSFWHFVTCQPVAERQISDLPYVPLKAHIRSKGSWFSIEIRYSIFSLHVTPLIFNKEGVEGKLQLT